VLLFSDVDEAMALLPVASEMLFQKGIEECMQYLDAVRWSPEQESKLLYMLSSLQINVLPDLAARLGMSHGDNSDCKHLDILKQSLQEMLSAISNRCKYSLPRGKVEEYIVSYFEAANASSDLVAADTCRSAILEEFAAIVQRIKTNEFSVIKEENYNSEVAWSVLLWLIEVIQRCDGKLFEMVFKMFCEDQRLRQAVRFSDVSGKVKIKILIDQFLKALGSGKIITTASLRVSFLERWADTMVLKVTFLSRGLKDRLGVLQRGMIDVAETLPLVDQRRIYAIWKEVFAAYSINPSIVLKWWAEKLQDAIISGKMNNKKECSFG
jgi:hypothetical protein